MIQGLIIVRENSRPCRTLAPTIQLATRKPVAPDSNLTIALNALSYVASIVRTWLTTSATSPPIHRSMDRITSQDIDSTSIAKSITRTFCCNSPSSAARFTDVVVFPDPPF